MANRLPGEIRLKDAISIAMDKTHSDLPSSQRGTVFNAECNDFPNEPGWYWWKPFDGVQHHRPEYVMVKHDPDFDGELRVLRAGTLYEATLPIQTMMGEWNFFAKLNTEKPE